MNIKPEILAPAGDYDKLVAAVQFGADAVYLGGEEFSMRVACNNFTDDEIKRGIDFAKSNGRKIYIATNVIMKNNDIEQVARFAEKIHSYGADAVILTNIYDYYQYYVDAYQRVNPCASSGKERPCRCSPYRIKIRNTQ